MNEPEVSLALLSFPMGLKQAVHSFHAKYLYTRC